MKQYTLIIHAGTHGEGSHITQARGPKWWSKRKAKLKAQKLSRKNNRT